MEKDLEKCLRDYELKEKQFGMKEKRFKEFELKEKAVKEQCRDLEINVKQYEHERKSLEAKEKLVQKQLEEIKRKEEELVQRRKDIEFKERSLELCFRAVKLNAKHYNECLRKVELREKKIEELSPEQRRKYEQQSSDLEFDVETYDQWLKDLESKEKEPVEWSKELEKKRGLASSLHPQLKAEAANILSVDHSSRAHLWFCVNTDGKNLQMFLNEHWTDQCSIGTEVVMSLQRSADPAKLVLEAMEGFYPPHLCKGDREFEGKVARRSILLLEHLMELSPEIDPHVREKAMILALIGKQK
ncbi:FRIGIDA-like protein 5 [Hibiscus syriacus]|uniref:FRIGIDA-like protein 5 n=1 Tax=Hibiscus syriacus TaxID=106335 RepID=UPI0019209B6F|nr:FRIGIDA-like protein 5 [Hibiscus syriacus]